MERQSSFGEALKGVIASFFSSAEKGIKRSIATATRNVDEKFEQYKNAAFLTLFRLALYLGGIALITAGIIVFFSGLITPELTLLLAGLLIVYIAFVLRRYELRS